MDDALDDTKTPGRRTAKDNAIGYVLLILLVSPFAACIIFLCLKLFGVVSWSWFAVFSPVLAMLGFFFLGTALYEGKDELKLDGLTVDEAKHKEKDAYIERQHISSKSWLIVSWIFAGFWHWLFGDSTGSPLWWTILYWAVQVGSVLFGLYMLWRGLRLIDEKYQSTAGSVRIEQGNGVEPKNGPAVLAEPAAEGREEVEARDADSGRGGHAHVP